ncbi:hypothetical protein Dimus_029124 [Dionaea muscipula]
MWKPSEGQNTALCGNNGVNEEDEQSKDNEEDNVMEDHSNETGPIHSSREGCFYNSQRLLEEDAAGEKSKDSEIGSENSVSRVRVTRSHEVIAHEMEGGKDGEFEEGRDVCLNLVSTCGGPPPGFEEAYWARKENHSPIQRNVDVGGDPDLREMGSKTVSIGEGDVNRIGIENGPSLLGKYNLQSYSKENVMSFPIPSDASQVSLQHRANSEGISRMTADHGSKASGRKQGKGKTRRNICKSKVLCRAVSASINRICKEQSFLNQFRDSEKWNEEEKAWKIDHWVWQGSTGGRFAIKDVYEYGIVVDFSVKCLIWEKVMPGSLQELFECWKGVRWKRRLDKLWVAFLNATLWYIWKSRNDVRFKGKKRMVDSWGCAWKAALDACFSIYLMLYWDDVSLAEVFMVSLGSLGRLSLMGDDEGVVAFVSSGSDHVVIDISSSIMRPAEVFLHEVCFLWWYIMEDDDTLVEEREIRRVDELVCLGCCGVVFMVAVEMSLSDFLILKSIWRSASLRLFYACAAAGRS